MPSMFARARPLSSLMLCCFLLQGGRAKVVRGIRPIIRILHQCTQFIRICKLLAVFPKSALLIWSPEVSVAY